MFLQQQLQSQYATFFWFVRGSPGLHGNPHHNCDSLSGRESDRRNAGRWHLPKNSRRATRTSYNLRSPMRRRHSAHRRSSRSSNPQSFEKHSLTCRTTQTDLEENCQRALSDPASMSRNTHRNWHGPSQGFLSTAPTKRASTIATSSSPPVPHIPIPLH